MSMKKKFLALAAASLISLTPISAKADSNDYAFVTAYNDLGRMADGNYTYYGAIACPRSMALGTQVEIDPFGVFTCEDRYSSRLSFRFDMALPGASVYACYQITGYYQWKIVQG